MPQIWVTRDELAAYLGSDSDGVAVAIAEMDLPCREDMDGSLRVMLPPGLATAYAAAQPAIRQAVLSAERRALPLRDIDETALLAAASAGGPDYVAGEFSDLLVARLRQVSAIAAAAGGDFGRSAAV